MYVSHIHAQGSFILMIDYKTILQYQLVHYMNVYGNYKSIERSLSNIRKQDITNMLKIITKVYESPSYPTTKKH